jgi:hypothetical protein
MSTPKQLETVDVVADHAIKMGEALKRLKENPDFKVLILEGYLEQKVLASVSLLAVPAIKSRGERPEVMEDLVSASNLQFFFMQVEDKYAGATDPVLSDEELEELETQGGVQ